MKKTEFYRKPQKVFAIQWTGRTDFIDALKEHTRWVEISVQPISPLSCPLISLTLVGEGRYTEGHFTEGHFTQTIHEDDWLVLDDGEAFIMTDEDFREKYFAVETETVTTMPDLEELL